MSLATFDALFRSYGGYTSNITGPQEIYLAHFFRTASTLAVLVLGVLACYSELSIYTLGSGYLAGVIMRHAFSAKPKWVCLDFWCTIAFLILAILTFIDPSVYEVAGGFAAFHAEITLMYIFIDFVLIARMKERMYQKIKKDDLLWGEFSDRHQLISTRLSTMHSQCDADRGPGYVPDYLRWAMGWDGGEEHWLREIARLKMEAQGALPADPDDAPPVAPGHNAALAHHPAPAAVAAPAPAWVVIQDPDNPFLVHVHV